MSTIQVTNINDLSDNEALVTDNGGIKTDKLTGKTTAGSISVVGEGNSTTTNLQQGLAKAWCSLDDASTVVFYDSFNFASVTDNGTGNYTVAFTNSMSGTRYSSPPNVYSGEGDLANIANEATGSFRLRCFEDSSPHPAKDIDCFTTTHGDLA